jgi:hypothetical protein
MSLVQRMLKHQTAVYWAPGATAWDEYGQPVSADPVELECRWEETNEEFIDAQGTRRVCSAKVYLGEDVEVGGKLMLGTLEEADALGFLMTDDRVFEIRSFAKTPNRRQTEWLRLAFI